MRETVYVHRVIPTAKPLVDRGGMQQLLQHLLQQIEAAFRDPNVQPTSSSAVVLQLLEPQSAEQHRELQKCLFEELQSLKATAGERLLQFNVEKIELRFPQSVPNTTATAAAPQQQILRASSRGGCWLELEETLGNGDSTSYDNECDMHASRAAQQPQQQPLTAEASTAESSTAPSPLLSESQTPEGRGSREADVATADSSTTRPMLIMSSRSQSSENLPFSWTGREAAAAAAAAAEAERTAPLVPLMGISETQLASKRAAAQRAGSTYIYDFLGLIRAELQQQWLHAQQELKETGDCRKFEIPQKLMEVGKPLGGLFVSFWLWLLRTLLVLILLIVLLHGIF